MLQQWVVIIDFGYAVQGANELKKSEKSENYASAFPRDARA
jgi:hypothetical protein